MTARRSLLQRARTRLTVERSLWDWTRALAPLRAVGRPRTDRSVLFCELMAMSATAKVESLVFQRGGRPAHAP